MIPFRGEEKKGEYSNKTKRKQWWGNNGKAI